MTFNSYSEEIPETLTLNLTLRETIESEVINK